MTSATPRTGKLSRLLPLILICSLLALSLATNAEALRARHEAWIWFDLNWAPSGMVYTFESLHDLRFVQYNFFEALYPVAFNTGIFKNHRFGLKSICNRYGFVFFRRFRCTNHVVRPCMNAEGIWYAAGEGEVLGPPFSVHPASSGSIYANCLPPVDVCVPGPEDPLQCGRSPIVIDLAGDSFRFTGLDDPVLFDIDGDHDLEAIGWTARRGDDGILAMDRDGDGRITSGAELFGDATRLADGELAPNGYVALAELDSPAFGGNGNGRIDPRDRRFRSLLIWLDANHDGVSQRRELRPLKSHRIGWISLDYFSSPLEDEHGNLLLFASPVRLTGADKSRVWSTDVFFVVGD